MDTSDMNESRDTFYSVQTSGVLDIDDDEDPYQSVDQLLAGENMLNSSISSYHSSQNQYCKPDSVVEFCIKSIDFQEQQDSRASLSEQRRSSTKSSRKSIRSDRPAAGEIIYSLYIGD